MSLSDLLDCIDIGAHTDSLSPSIRSTARRGHHRFIWLLGLSANKLLFVVFSYRVVSERLLFDIALRDSGLSGLLLMDRWERGSIWNNFWRFVVLCSSVSCSYALWCDSPVLLILLDFQLRLSHCLIGILLIVLCCILRLRLLAFAATSKLWRFIWWLRCNASYFLIWTATVTDVLWLSRVFCTWLLQLHCSVTKFVSFFLNLNFDFVLSRWCSWCLIIVVFWFAVAEHRVRRIDIDDVVATSSCGYLCHDFCLIVIISVLPRSSALSALLSTYFIAWNTRR